MFRMDRINVCVQSKMLSLLLCTPLLKPSRPPQVFGNGFAITGPHSPNETSEDLLHHLLRFDVPNEKEKPTRVLR